MAAPPQLLLAVTRTANEIGSGATSEQQGKGGATAWRTVKSLLFLMAIALPCLVLYRSVAPGAGLVLPGAAAVPWRLGAPRDDVNMVSLLSHR
jgi:hypothetical protein